MRLHLAPCLALLALALAPAALAGSAGAAVFNGYPAAKGRYPWMASLVAQNFEMDEDNNVILKEGRHHSCGASLIHPRVLLTVAHCIYSMGIGEFTSEAYPELPDETFPQVRLGAYDTSVKDMGLETRRVIAATVHRRYNTTATGNENENDIALLLLDRPSRLQPVALPKSKRVGAAVQPGTELFLIGWGTSGYKPVINVDEFGIPIIEDVSVNPRVLQEVDLPLNTPALCARRYPQYPSFWKGNAFHGAICAGLPYRKATSCHGDSGGPLFVKAKRGSKQQDLQVGIVSFASGCGTQFPSVFTNVAHYMDWINGGIKVLLERGARPASCRKTVVVGDYRVRCK